MIRLLVIVVACIGLVYFPSQAARIGAHGHAVGAGSQVSSNEVVMRDRFAAIALR